MATEQPDFVVELWNELRHMRRTLRDIDGKEVVAANFEQLRAACAAVIRKASARQFLKGLGGEEMRLRMRYTPQAPEDVIDEED